MFAHHYKLDNLCVIIDNNGLQIDGNVADVMNPYPIVDKLRAFGIETMEIDGHDFEQIEAAFYMARVTKGRPFAIVMKTDQRERCQLYGESGSAGTEKPRMMRNMRLP